MAKKIDLSGLRKKPIKRKAPIAPKKDDQIVEAIHKEEVVKKVIIPEPVVKQEVKKPVPKVVLEIPVPEKEPLKRVTLDLPLELHTKLKIYAVTNQTTIRKFVIDLLEQVLE